jgi:glycosyltransferase involved in cell wall biosynthesis
LTARIWIDVEDIFIFAANGRTPTGIQRLSFELCRALHEIYGGPGDVRLLRQSRSAESFVEVPWESLDGLFTLLAARAIPQPPPEPPPEPPPPEPPPPVVPPAGWRGPVRRVLRPVFRLVPGRLRAPLADYVRLQARAIYALGDVVIALLRAGVSLGRYVGRGFRRAEPPPPPEPEPIAPEPEPEPEPEAEWAPEPGDVLFVAGAAWFNPEYATVLTSSRARFGVHVALLIYDIIPLRRPEWCDRQHAEAFRQWFDAVLPLCDTIFAISRASADEVSDYARRHGMTMRDAIHAIPIGTGFSPSRAMGDIASVPAPGGFAHLPAPGSYVLFVSTIEARKNHALLFRVWRHLMEQMPEAQVPTLVFAGRIGWLVADLMQQLENTAWLGGKIVLVEHPSDDELIALYRGCRFTLFPSFYEGWGLPVSESLALGKPCVISNRTSLPEAGGDLARYFDPEDVGDALRVIRATIEDAPGLAAWETRVVRDFRPVTWHETARAIIGQLPFGRSTD